MANVRRDDNRVRIRYWSAELDRLQDIPRKEISFLDRCSDDEVEQWVSLWEQSQGPKVRKAQESLLLETDEARLLFESFLTRYANRRKTSPATLRDERGRFYKHIVPVLVGDLKRKDVRTWSTGIPHLANALQGKGELAPGQINKCLGLIKRFSKNLKATGVIPNSWEVDYLPTESSTPLALEVRPEQVLAFVDSTADVRLKLLALMGYFGSLRPSETFALSKDDFLTGDLAVTQSPTYARFKKYGFGSRLTVHVRRSMDSYSKIQDHTKKEILRKRSARIAKDTKKEVVGQYVTIWNTDAAKKIGAILKDLPEGPLFCKPSIYAGRGRLGRPLPGAK